MAAKRSRAKKVHVNKYAHKPRAMSRSSAKQSADTEQQLQRTIADIREASRYPRRGDSASIEELEAELHRHQRPHYRQGGGDQVADTRSDDEIWPEYTNVS